ncbi:MAG: hypothetical protein WCA49_23110 [Candidatus Sulfotelmatobacter sp.]
MTTQYGSTRWWENYAVRYLMPSIAGMVIVNWLCKNGSADLRSLLSLPLATERIDTASLTLLFLYGNLFCYIASYPILVFHATRVLDFENDAWPALPLSDGYLLTGILAAIAFPLAHFATSCRLWGAFVLVIAFTIFQLRRLRLAFYPRIVVDGCSGRVSRSYGYSYALARRRGRIKKTSTTTARSVSGDFDDDEDVTTTRQIVWHQDYMDTYRHLREHGNSAFIFLLELGLAALVYCVITKSNKTAPEQLGVIAVLLAIWAIPAVLVHLIAQHMERRFSHYDRRLERGE